MRRKLIVLLMLIGFVLSSCGDRADNLRIIADLEKRVELLRSADSSSGAQDLADKIEANLLNEGGAYKLTDEEVESLQFLYAYMPLNDMAENSFDYFVRLTKQTNKVKELPWGKSLTPELFQYYVLPPRVNNETLDDARFEFYKELYPRVKDLSMYDAVLEVNHWCREKVVYKPTDGRTTQPLNVVERAYGRCGEESTLAVVALRSVGIPARQVYVPRWAHTNSNHAWVEVWVDGEWYYLGACEPEPMLNRGWFTASASRALLINSYAYGMLTPSDDTQIKGEIISQSNLFTEVSSTATYTDVTKAVVNVTDASGKPVEDAIVSFSIINGNNLAPLVRRKTDNKGSTSLTTGLGTYIIEVYSAVGEGLYAIREFRVMDGNVLNVILKEDERMGADRDIKVEDFVITPPPETRFPTALSDEVAREHDIRCAIDDSIRLAHTQTFRFNDAPQVDQFVSSMRNKGLSSPSAAKLSALLSESLSGGRSIEAFLNEVKPEHLELAVQLLQEIRIKDIHEITKDVYMDYLYGVIRLYDVYKDTPEFRQSVLNPRFSNEIPIAYKAKMWELLTENGMHTPGANAETITAVRTIADKVVLADAEEVNPRGFFMTPVSVADFGIADRNNYIAFVRSLLSTAGIPNRVDFQTSNLQIFVDRRWEDFELKAIEIKIESVDTSQLATLTVNDPEGYEQDRRYAIQRWNDDGYESIGGFRRDIKSTQEYSLLPGIYRIVTGIRAADGGMLTRVMNFELTAGEKKTVDVQWYAIEEDELVVIGNMDAEWEYTKGNAQSELEVTSILNTVGRNFFVLAVLEPTKEPSQHFIRELSAIGEELKLPTVILFNNAENMNFFFKQDYRLKDDLHYGFDSEGVIMRGLTESLKTSDLSARLPVVIVADSFGNIFYQSVGYNIGVPKAIIDLKLPIHGE